MRRHPQLLPTLAILAGAGLLIAGVYRALPPWLAMVGVVVLFAGGVWALARSGVERRERVEAFWADRPSGAPPMLGDVSGVHHHHHGGHHGGFGGGFFDGGGHHGGGHGGHGGG